MSRRGKAVRRGRGWGPGGLFNGSEGDLSPSEGVGHEVSGVVVQRGGGGAGGCGDQGTAI